MATTSRRSILKGAAAIGLGLGVSSKTFLPTAFAQGAKGKVVYWTAHSGLGFKAFQQMGKDYNAKSDKYEVEIVQRPPGTETDSASLITAVRGGTGPDVYLLDRFIVGERAASGLLEDLTPFMEAAGDDPSLTDKYAKFAAEEAHYDGTPYAFPFDTDLRALFFNKKLIQEAGADMTKWSPDAEPMTWDSLTEVFNKVNKKKSSGEYEQVGFVPYRGQGWHYTYGFAAGGEFFDYDKCEVTPDSEKNIQAFKWVQEYCKAAEYDKLYNFSQIDSKPGSPPTDSPFIQGRLAAQMDGNWVFAGFKEYAPKTEYSYCPTPVFKEGDPSITWAGGWSGVMPAGAKNPEGAYDFIKYLCGEEGQRTYITINNNLPTSLNLLKDEKLLGKDLFWFAKQFETTRNRPVLPVGAKFWDEMTASWQEIYLGKATPEDAMKKAKENTMSDLESGGYCPIAKPE